MRKKIVLSIAALSAVALMTLIVISCDKKVPDNISTATTNSQVQQFRPASSLNICPCASTVQKCSCIQEVITKGKLSRDFKISWTTCSSCGQSLPTNSTGEICYIDGSCDSVYVQLNNLPDCLQNCYGNIGCVQAKMTCDKKNHTYAITFISADGTQEVDITGDPHITVKCTDANGVSYVCDGEMTYTN